MERDQLIAEVARTTGVRLDKSDPILAAAVIHEALLNEALIKLDRQVTTQADRITIASTQVVLDAKREAEALLNEAGSWIEMRIKETGEAVAARMLEQIGKQAEKAETARIRAVRMVWLVTATGLVLLSGVVGLMLPGLR